MTARISIVWRGAKANAVSADAQAILRRFDVLKLFHIAFLGPNATRQALKNPHGGSLIEGANVSLGLFDPGDLLGHRY
ncbi:MAG TPA: hypothetical protein VMT86_15770 [Bryobacteraceae bacterium]|nr:hypothetical protein [Bryobacteraceae bacterium]